MQLHCDFERSIELIRDLGFVRKATSDPRALGLSLLNNRKHHLCTSGTSFASRTACNNTAELKTMLRFSTTALELPGKVKMILAGQRFRARTGQ